MGLFGLGKRKSSADQATGARKRGRPTRAEAAQRAAERTKLLESRARARELKREDEFWEHLRATDPERYYSLMAAKVGVATGEKAGPEDRISTTVKTLKDLRGAGLLDDPSQAADSTRRLEAILNSAVGVKVVELLGPALGTRLVGALAGDGVGPGVSQGAQGQHQSLVDTEAVVVPSPDAPPPTSPEEIVAMLQSSTGEQAARWLLSQGQMNPSVREFVGVLARTPDAALPGLLGTLEGQAPPATVPVLTWLRTNPDRLVAMVQALRQLIRAGTPGPGA